VVATFLLIGHKGESHWPLVLSQALAPLGNLEIASEEEMDERFQNQYEAIIIDAGAVNEVPSLVSHLRVRCPETPIVVATASPTWQRAREAYQAGATDYIRKTMDQEELYAILADILSRALLPGQERRSERTAST